MKISMTILKLQSGYDFETNNFIGHYYAKSKAGVTVLFSTRRLMLLYNVPSFMKTSLTVLKL